MLSYTDHRVAEPWTCVEDREPKRASGRKQAQGLRHQHTVVGVKSPGRVEAAPNRGLPL